MTCIEPGAIYSLFAAMNAHPFTIQHGPADARISERPRKIITVDGKFKSLMIKESTILATVPVSESDDLLWMNARAALPSLSA